MSRKDTHSHYEFNVNRYVQGEKGVQKYLMKACFIFN